MRIYMEPYRPGEQPNIASIRKIHGHEIPFPYLAGMLPDPIGGAGGGEIKGGGAENRGMGGGASGGAKSGGAGGAGRGPSIEGATPYGTVGGAAILAAASQVAVSGALSSGVVATKTASPTANPSTVGGIGDIISNAIAQVTASITSVVSSLTTAPPTNTTSVGTTYSTGVTAPSTSTVASTTTTPTTTQIQTTTYSTGTTAPTTSTITSTSTSPIVSTSPITTQTTTTPTSTTTQQQSSTTQLATTTSPTSGITVNSVNYNSQGVPVSVNTNIGTLTVNAVATNLTSGVATGFEVTTPGGQVVQISVGVTQSMSPAGTGQVQIAPGTYSQDQYSAVNYGSGTNPATGVNAGVGVYGGGIQTAPTTPATMYGNIPGLGLYQGPAPPTVQVNPGFTLAEAQGYGLVGSNINPVNANPSAFNAPTISTAGLPGLANGQLVAYNTSTGQVIQIGSNINMQLSDLSYLGPGNWVTGVESYSNQYPGGQVLSGQVTLQNGQIVKVPT